ncbi:MAG: DUF87 domain-containing protein [Clostridia bacterium]|nr:DUF87 domain-containing protein [Clostridia bacterium]
MKRRKNAPPRLLRLPRTTQQTIPVEEVFEDGMMRCGPVYSCAFTLEDTDYAATSDDYQEDVLRRYEELIKSLGSDVDLKVVLMNRLVDEEKLHEAVHVPLKGDAYDGLRRELNDLNWARALRGENRVRRDRCLVLSGRPDNPEQAAAWFSRLGDSLTRSATALGTAVRRQDAAERLSLLGSFFRPGVPYAPPEKLSLLAKRAGRRQFADRIAPDGMTFDPAGAFFRIDDRYGRALMIRDFPVHLDDSLLAGMMDLPREMLLAADYRVMTKEQALRIVHGHKDKIEADIRKRTVSSGREGNWNAAIPRHLEEERATCEYMFDLINQCDQRLVFAQVVLVHMADSLAQLDLDTQSIQAAGRRAGADIGVLRHRQEQGLNTALPYGLEQVRQRRIISSENAAFLVPFRTREVFESGGIVYGINEISRNLVMMNRRRYKNGNAFIVGDAGGGKSVLAKTEMHAVFLSTDDDMIILDPDGEYARITEWLGGQVVNISAESRDHINMLDVSGDYGHGDDLVTLKCSLLSGAVDLMMRGQMSGPQRSVLDRCVNSVLARYLTGTAPVPTLVTLHDELLAQSEQSAREVALAMELYVRGSQNVFAQPTNVNTHNRLVCFDIRRLSPQLRDLGMMVVLDEIDRRVAQNRRAGRHTWIWCDEIWTLLAYPQTCEYLWGFWKRCRKYGGLPTGITQSLTAIAASEKGLEMLSNSELVFMMGMSADDRAAAAELFGLSADQQGFLKRAEPGHGLMRAGRTIIPLDACLDTDSDLYRVVSTKLEEVTA